MTTRWHDSSGFSLVHTIVGMAIGAIVAFSTASLVTQTKKTEVQNEALLHLSQIHTLSLHKSKSISSLKPALGLTAGSPLGDCFSGRGLNCSAFAISSWTAIPGFHQVISEPGSRTIMSTGYYTIQCSSPNFCEALVIRVYTSLNQGSILISQRDSQVRIGGMSLGDRQKIDFSCAMTSGQLLTAMDLGTLTGECLPLPSSTPCSGNRPMTQYVMGGALGCQPALTISCANGLKTVGILSGQGACL